VSRPTLGDMADTMQAAVNLAETHVHLPEPHFDVSPYYPGRVSLSLHGGFGNFEAWRAALGIPECEVRLTSGASQAYLTAVGSFEGAEVVLTGYSDRLPGGGE
jgi:hypothetical protein